MRRDQVLQLGTGLYHDFLENYGLAVETDEAEYIHQFRVAVKKLRALAFFLTTDRSEAAVLLESEHLTACIQPVYKSAGKVRNMQVLLDVLGGFTWPGPEGFRQHIYEQLHQRKLVFLQEAQLAALLSPRAWFAELDTLVRAHPETLETSVEQVVGDLAGRAFSLMQASGPGEDWHEARSCFKKAAHLLLMAGEVGLASPGQHRFMPFREAEQLLGTWHDFYMLGRFMDKYLAVLGRREKGWDELEAEYLEQVRQIELAVRDLPERFPLA